MRAAELVPSALCLLVAPLAIAQAADRAVTLRAPAEVAEGLGAMPRILAPADSAEARINKALDSLDAMAVKGLKGCKAPDGTPGGDSRNVTSPMRGPGFLSLVIADSAACGGPHPNNGTMAIVYDLTTGAPVDWAKLLPAALVGKQALRENWDGVRMVTLSSARLLALFKKAYRRGDGDQADCLRAIDDEIAGGPPQMSAWLDAKSEGLAVQFDLPYAVQDCGVPAIIPAAELKRLGASPRLLKALGAARAAKSFDDPDAP